MVKGLLVLMFCFIFTSLLFAADAVYLKSGKIVRGKILRGDTDTVTIETNSGTEEIIDRNDIKKIVKGVKEKPQKQPVTTKKPDAAPVHQKIAKGKLGIGLNFPGFGMRYFLTDKISLEGKGQGGSDIGVYGLRGYYYFNPEAKLLLLAGSGLHLVSFKEDVSEGSGVAIEIFGGGEYFFAKSFSVQMDFGPALISLSDTDSSESVSAVGFAVNLGINFYFGK